MNEMLDNAGERRGADFCRSVLKHLDIEVDVKGAENLPPRENRRVTIVSNHPLGGLDGMALIDWATGYWGGTVRFVVNDLLMAIEPLTDVFIPINKHGAQSRRASMALDEAMEGDDPVIIFPAGLVSRRGRGGVVRDLEWRKMFLVKSLKAGRDIVPVHFNGSNSSFFYKFAKLRKRLGLKLNIEMVRLPREVFLSRGARYTITVGKMMSCAGLKQQDCGTAVAAIKDYVYALAQEDINN